MPSPSALAVLAMLASLLAVPTLAPAAGRSRQAQIAAAAAPATDAPLAPHAPDELLVRFKPSQGARAAQLHARQRASVLHRFAAVAGLERVRLPGGTSIETAIRAYQADPSVLYAEPNYEVEAFAVPNDALFSELWGLRNVGQEEGVADADIDAPEAWDLSTGSSDVVVAVIDTGINYDHPDLAPNMFRNEVECTPNGIDDDANGWIDDCHGIDAVWDDGDPYGGEHGSHVAGTIGARGNNGIGVAGVNWNVRILSCAFIFRNSGKTSDAVECLDYVAMMKDRGVNIVASNNSWGGTGFSQALLDAIDEQRARGILFVASAGNAGTEAAGFFPSSYYLPNMLTVAATTRTDALATFSNFGPTTTHLGAPGQAILSTTTVGSYDRFNGTSMASPHVTGALALLKAQDPGREWKTLRNLVLAGGDATAALADTTVTGKRLNLHGAMTCAGKTVASRLRPVRDVASIGVGHILPLAALHIDCASPAGNVPVTVEPGGAAFDLLDDGAGYDQEAGDGVYSGTWSSAVAGTYTLTIADSAVTVHVGVDGLVSPEARSGNRFGWALAADGPLMIVGEVGNDTGALDAGAAHVVDVTTGATVRSFYNPDPDATEEFGSAVAISGGYALVGVPYDDVPNGETGAAYLFDVATGALLHTFHAPVPTDGAWFGYAVAFVNGNPAIGAPGDDVGPPNAGAVYLFDRDTGALLHAFRNVEPAQDEAFGWALTALGSTLAIGAPQDGPASEPNVHVGFVHLVDADTGSPTFGELERTIYNILPPGGYAVSFGAALATFGSDLLVGDGVALVTPSPGSPFVYVPNGAAHLVDPASGARKQSFLSPIAFDDSYFGWAVAGVGDRVLVGAPLDNTFGIAAGAIYAFEASTGAALRVFPSPAPGIGHLHGFAMTAADGSVFASAPQDDTAGIRAGAVYRLRLPPPVDRARCYKAKTAPGAAKLPKQTLTLADELATTTSVVGGPLATCNAASQAGSTIVAADAHLTCHKLKDGTGALAATALRTLGPVGVDYLTIAKAYALCVPSGYGGDPAPTGLDAYKCYRAKATKEAPKFVKRTLALADTHGARTADLAKPLAVCAPVSIGGGTVANPETFLTCYQAKDAKGQAPVPAATVAVASTLGAETLATQDATTLCVPSQRLAHWAPEER